MRGCCYVDNDVPGLDTNLMHALVPREEKRFKQIADIPNSFVVNDHVDVGIGNKIPLWLFGSLH